MASRDSKKRHYIRQIRVCSKHFISGSPVQLYNRNSPDWVPSLHMGYPEAEDLESSSDAVGRYGRAAKRARTKSLSEPQSNSEVEDESGVWCPD